MDNVLAILSNFRHTSSILHNFPTVYNTRHTYADRVVYNLLLSYRHQNTKDILRGGDGLGSSAIVTLQKHCETTTQQQKVRYRTLFTPVRQHHTNMDLSYISRFQQAQTPNRGEHTRRFVPNERRTELCLQSNIGSQIGFSGDKTCLLVGLLVTVQHRCDLNFGSCLLLLCQEKFTFV